VPRRRGNGEGSVFQRADGQWAAYASLGYDGAGKRKRRTIYGRTKAEVLDKLRILQNEAASGLISDAGRMTVGEFLEKWLTDVAVHKVKPTTFHTYQWHTRKRIIPRIGGIKLTKLTPLQIQGLYSQMIRDGLSTRATQHVHLILHASLEQAVRWGLIGRNPCDAVQKPRHTYAPMKVLSPEQTREFLKTARSDRLYAIYVLAITTGLRQGELLGLYWEDIDFINRTLSVRRSLAEIAGEFSIGETKSAKGKRAVALPQSAIEALEDHRRRMKADGHSGPLVFCDKDGGYIRKSNLLRRSFKPLLEKAELPDIRFHDLRHTSATLLLVQGVHPKVVQERLGHSQISLTLDTYSHVLPSMQQDAADRMDSLLGKEPNASGDLENVGPSDAESEYWLQNGYSEGEEDRLLDPDDADFPNDPEWLNWWLGRDSNPRPTAYETVALTT